jgi:hypothetical protein
MISGGLDRGHLPEDLDQAITGAVTSHLTRELSERGLLLSADRMAAAEAHATREGQRLCTWIAHGCAPGARLSITAARKADAARLGAALAFGAAVGRLLSPRHDDDRQSPASVEVLCAIFNLTIGLVDGFCDGDPANGVRLLGLLRAANLLEAVSTRPQSDWLRAQVPAFSQDAPVAAIVELVEMFGRTIHSVYPGERWTALRERVGQQLEAALDAEQQSIEWLHRQASREQLLECSRLTSVLPFQIIQTLAGGDVRNAEASAATLLGEATWQIDDLVDICADVRSGALNSILLAATDSSEPSSRGEDPMATLASIIDSPDIARAAARAADNLTSGLRLTPARRDYSTEARRMRPMFVHFLQRYAGIAPLPSHAATASRRP